MSREVETAVPEERSSGGQAPEIWVLLVSMALSAVLGVVATRSYLALHNTLDNNGNWESTKTGLERGLLGAYSFMSGRQTLAGGALRLDAWHGHNEVTFVAEPVETERIELDLRLAEQAYLTIFFDRVPGESWEGVLLSTMHRFRSRTFEAAPSGGFLGWTPLVTRVVAPEEKLRIRIELGADRIEIFVDDVSYGEYERAIGARPGTFGFRAGHQRVIIDNVVAVQADGSRWVDSFDQPAGSNRVILGVVLALLLANLGLFLLLKRVTQSEGLILAFTLLMVNATLLAVSALVFFFVLMRADRYLFAPDDLSEQEAYFRKGAADVVMAQIREQHPTSPADGAFRILFMGGSQTWGAGATREEDVFIPILEEMLNEAARRNAAESGTEPTRFECINAGFSAHKVMDLVPLLDELLPSVRPDMVVLNVSSNDKGNSHFAKPLRRLVRMSLEAGASVVFVLEANSLESLTRGLTARHAEMTEVASAFDLPVIDMHGYLASIRYAGFLWWDHVHLTDFGQRLMAERLLEELSPLLSREVSELSSGD